MSPEFQVLMQEILSQGAAVAVLTWQMRQRFLGLTQRMDLHEEKHDAIVAKLDTLDEDVRALREQAAAPAVAHDDTTRQMYPDGVH